MIQVIDRWARYGIVRGTSAPLRFGLLIDSFEARAWQRDCVDALVGSGLAVPALVVLPADGDRKVRQVPALARRAATYAATGTPWRPRALRRISLNDLVSGIPIVRTSALAVGGRWRGPLPSEVREIEAHALDFLLQFGVSLIEGEILAAARFGIWSFRHGEDRYLRGAPVGFWEIDQGAREIAATLQRLTDKPEIDTVLKRGTFAVKPSDYAGMLDRMYFGSSDFPLQVCRDIALGNGPELLNPPSRPRARAYSGPKARTVARVLARELSETFRRYVYGASSLKHWSIGRAIGAEQLLRGELRVIRWYENPDPLSIRADPFIVPGSNGDVVLCEVMDYRNGRGSIGRIDLSASDDGAGVDKATTIITDTSSHLSYPCLITVGGELWCIPESAETGGLRAYLLSADGRRVLGSRPLIAGISAIDPTVFWFGDRWWLALTEAGPTSHSHLWLYHSITWSGPWQAHARNPVKVDAGGARGAGRPFVVGGSTYRPAQDLRERYGGAIQLFRILELSPRAFREESVAVFRPDPATPNAGGLHTLAVEGDSVVVDGFREVRDLRAGWYRWAARQAKRDRVRPSG